MITKINHKICRLEVAHNYIMKPIASQGIYKDKLMCAIKSELDSKHPLWEVPVECTVTPSGTWIIFHTDRLLFISALVCKFCSLFNQPLLYVNDVSEQQTQ